MKSFKCETCGKTVKYLNDVQIKGCLHHRMPKDTIRITGIAPEDAYAMASYSLIGALILETRNMAISDGLINNKHFVKGSMTFKLNTGKIHNGFFIGVKTSNNKKVLAGYKRKEK